MKFFFVSFGIWSKRKIHPAMGKFCQRISLLYILIITVDLRIYVKLKGLTWSTEMNEYSTAVVFCKLLHLFRSLFVFLKSRTVMLLSKWFSNCLRNVFRTTLNKTPFCSFTFGFVLFENWNQHNNKLFTKFTILPTMETCV